MKFINDMSSSLQQGIAKERELRKCLPSFPMEQLYR